MAKINLPADLPMNWSPGQTVAPSGEEAGLSKQHGYNYLMEQVNTAQKTLNEIKADEVAYSNDDMQDVSTVAEGIDRLSEQLATKSTLYDTTATYASTTFTLTSTTIPTTLPPKFSVRFTAPAKYTTGDKIKVNSTTFTVVTSKLEPLPDDAFANGAMVSMDIDTAGGKAYFGGGVGSTGGWKITTAATLPTTVTPSTIVAITSIPMTGSVYSETEPSNPQQGLVWVSHTPVQGTVSDGGNPVSNLKEAKIRNSGAWVGLVAYYSVGTEKWLPLLSIPDGKTVTPVNDKDIWLSCANMSSADTLAQIVANTALMTVLANSSNAVDYMIRSTGAIMSAVVGSTNAMTCVGLSSYAMNSIIPQSTWTAAISMSANAIEGLDASNPITIPTMTSNTTPVGIVTAVSEYTPAFRLFDKTQEAWVYTISTVPAICRYAYTLPVWFYKLIITQNFDPTRYSKDFDIVATNDNGITYDILHSGTLVSSAGAAITVILNLNKKYQSVGIRIKSYYTQAYSASGISELQVLGK